MSQIILLRWNWQIYPFTCWWTFRFTQYLFLTLLIPVPCLTTSGSLKYPTLWEYCFLGSGFGSQQMPELMSLRVPKSRVDALAFGIGHCKLPAIALWWEHPYLDLWPGKAVDELSRISDLSSHPPVWDSIPKGKASSPSLHPCKPRAHKLPFGVLVPKERGGGNHCLCLPGTPQVALLDDLALEDQGSLVRRSWGFGQKNLDTEDKKGP